MRTKEDDVEALEVAKLVRKRQPRSYVQAAFVLADALVGLREQYEFTLRVEEANRTRAIELEAALRRLDPVRGIANER